MLDVVTFLRLLVVTDEDDVRVVGTEYADELLEQVSHHAITLQ